LTGKPANKDAQAFTLIELMIVVAVLGILAALAIANFAHYDCTAKQSEAKINLGAIHKNEEAYFAEYDTYTASKGAIGFAVKGNDRYNYTITVANGTGFTAKATDGPDGDVWSINSTGSLSNDTNGCI
jgi:prepilin-type N-terminal cleavage/methylation domain-containing protein